MRITLRPIKLELGRTSDLAAWNCYIVQKLMEATKTHTACNASVHTACVLRLAALRELKCSAAVCFALSALSDQRICTQLGQNMLLQRTSYAFAPCLFPLSSISTLPKSRASLRRRALTGPQHAHNSHTSHIHPGVSRMSSSSSVSDANPNSNNVWSHASRAHWLEEPIRVRGAVQRGFGRGSADLGTPTANLPASLLRESEHNTVRDGVYAGFAKLENGHVVNMVANIGWNITYGDLKERVLEAHLMSDAVPKEFYGKMMTICMAVYLRPELKFESIQDLIAGIENDKLVAKQVLLEKRARRFEDDICFKRGWQNDAK